ncbi:uncharacterized protein FTJAE_5861 [Fusarium tjaetaba]|uniref:Uncharacterized protein n=1 Tax=Fusarium tjaetaba TaxID=1567544 RepID=A0A8H5RRA4_9HYPO|nr:uncharacterized protein FTJAE_5861 [Fusarium tjaetaba]KAF5636666.1 hypothetical protein FTJAE_5861 [Fusarium tjaetaba]
MKATLQLITAALAVSVAAHPQNGRGGGKPSSTTTAAAASSTTAAPGRGAMSSLPFLPTWLFRDSNANKCISTYNNCLITNSSNQSACASSYAACIKGGSSTTGSATSAQTATTTVSSAGGPPTRTFSRPSVSGLAQWWRNEQAIRRCNYAYYVCRRKSGSTQTSCASDRTACISSASATAVPTSVPTGIPTSAATTTATGSAATSSVASSSTTVVPAGTGTANADAPLNSDDPSFDDENYDADTA